SATASPDLQTCEDCQRWVDLAHARGKRGPRVLGSEAARREMRSRLLQIPTTPNGTSAGRRALDAEPKIWSREGEWSETEPRNAGRVYLTKYVVLVKLARVFFSVSATFFRMRCGHCAQRDRARRWRAPHLRCLVSRLSTASCPTMMVAGWLATGPQLPSESGNFTLAPPSATRVWPVT